MPREAHLKRHFRLNETVRVSVVCQRAKPCLWGDWQLGWHFCLSD
jgi:hypothetical protein